MKLLLLVALAVMASATYLSEFQNWMYTHNKIYSSAEESSSRFSIWLANKKFIEAHDPELKGYTLAMNEFGDLTNEEFRTLYLGTHVTVGDAAFRRGGFATGYIVYPAESLIGVPASMDWRQKGAVTGIKNQGQCGSCWSFSTTGSVEGANVLQAKKTLVGLSEKNLMDCSTSFGNQGCNGGLMTDAFRYIISNSGIDSEASYPYVPQDGSCQFNKANVAATIKGYTSVQSGNETALLVASANIGPVSVAIDASHNSFQFYSGGVYYEPACSTTQLDHGVLVVGYGMSGSTAYWLVKNSWGTTWGLQGYIMMSRNRNNNCGIATTASYPLSNQATTTSTGSGSSSQTGSSSNTQTGSSSNTQTGSSSNTQTGSSSASQTGSSSNTQTGSSSASQTSATGTSASTASTGASSTASTGASTASTAASTGQTGSTASTAASTGQTGQTSTGQTGQTSTGQTGQTSTGQTSTGQTSGQTSASSGQTSASSGQTSGQTSASSGQTSSTGQTSGQTSGQTTAPTPNPSSTSGGSSGGSGVITIQE